MGKTLLASCFVAALLFVACGGGDSVSSVSNDNTGQVSKPAKGADSTKDKPSSNQGNQGNSNNAVDSSDGLPKGSSSDLKSSGAGVLNNKKVAFEQMKDASGDIPPQPVLN